MAYGYNDPVDAYKRAVAVERALGLKSQPKYESSDLNDFRRLAPDELSIRYQN